MFKKFISKLLIGATIFSTSIIANTNTVLAAAKPSVSTTQNSIKYEVAKVAKVIDGDTIQLTDGRKVRLIGVNSPESTTKKEYFGVEASNYTKSKLANKTVYLEKDKSDKDIYGRLLRYVWLQKPVQANESEIRSKLFNANLVINGYATSSRYYPDVKYSNYFDKFMNESKTKKLGMCKPVTQSSKYVATLSNYTPKKNSHISLNVSGVTGKNYTAKVKYKSKDTIYNGKVGTPLSFSTGHATTGYKVIIEIYVDGKLVTTTSFTPIN